MHTQLVIKGIPANFLLDKNRKIIAVDLRENDLMKYMGELNKIHSGHKGLREVIEGLDNMIIT